MSYGGDSIVYQKFAEIMLTIFTGLIIITNLCLIIKLTRVTHYLHRPKCLILVSMSCGDVLLGVATLVAVRYTTFREYLPGESTCSFMLPATVYRNYLANAIYGIGLIMLSAEVIWRRHQVTTTLTSVVKGVVVSCLPWGVGLVIVLPITVPTATCYMYNFGYTPDLMRAQLVLSTLAPACLALLSILYVICVKTDDTTKQTNNMLCKFKDKQEERDKISWSYREKLETTPDLSVNLNIRLCCHEVCPAVSPANHDITPSSRTGPHYTETHTLLSLTLLYCCLVTPRAGYFLLHTQSLNPGDARQPMTRVIVADDMMWLILLRPIVTALVAASHKYVTDLW
ncbi:uncharacterized protein LOC131956439 [Physella acuta]|uniref:uncharacterized protein LOC131956439 n=1 Tax=Physella acuta TaxID=109671 RepID=UPI0027DDB444|nr:uncharacterized protein LOC131956439 [Physella acuta]